MANLKRVTEITRHIVTTITQYVFYSIAGRTRDLWVPLPVARTNKDKFLIGLQASKSLFITDSANYNHLKIMTREIEWKERIVKAWTYNPSFFDL